MKDIVIEQLPKEKWKGHILPIGYTADEYYKAERTCSADGFSVSFKKAKADKSITHTPDEYDYPDKLYEDWWEGAYAWGVTDGDELLAAIETCPEQYSNRLRITELWVSGELRGRGVGRELIETAMEQARIERRRAVILETQSCNANAIGFYMHMGFSFMGFDACCYKNDDILRDEVRVELGVLLERGSRLTDHDVTIREECEADRHAAEQMTKDAFWNKYCPGCNEHLLVNMLRGSSDWLPGLSRVAVMDGEIIGAIYFSKAYVLCGDVRNEICTFGPLCVSPKHQGRGVGELLLRAGAKAAREAGYAGIMIYGEPDYYPRLGFKTADCFRITTPDGKNFDAFMGMELIDGGLSRFAGGRFFESQVFDELSKIDVDAFDKSFVPAVKRNFPKQWQ